MHPHECFPYILFLLKLLYKEVSSINIVSTPSTEPPPARDAPACAMAASCARWLKHMITENLKIESCKTQKTSFSHISQQI